MVCVCVCVFQGEGKEGADILKYIQSQLQSHCTDDTCRKRFESVLHGAEGSGLIIHERFLNIPMDIGPPMLENLMFVDHNSFASVLLINELIN